MMKGVNLMKRLFGAITILLFTAAAFAADFELSPLGIVVNPKPGFSVDVGLNKGGATPSYEVGEHIQISVTVSENSYIYLFNVRSDGQIVQILPNELDGDGRNNYVRSGETKTFPPRGADYTFDISTPYGLDKVIALASRSQLNTRTLANFASGDSFATSSIGEGGFAQALGIIVTPIPQSNWVTDTAQFYVGAPPAPQPSRGTISISSEPSGAEVYVDDSFVGYAPFNYSARSGRHDVRVQLAGYETFRDSVNVRPQETSRVNARLTPIRRTGDVTFTSSPSGADVFIDGDFQGVTPLRRVTFETGSYEARFELGGYDSERIGFQVQAGSERTVNANLRSRAGSIRLTANIGGAQVFLNGVASGTIPSGTGVLNLPGLASGTYEITVVAPNHHTYVKDVRVRSGEVSEIRVRQERH